MLKNCFEDAELGQSWTKSFQALARPNGSFGTNERIFRKNSGKALTSNKIEQVHVVSQLAFNKAEILIVLSTIERQKSLLNLALQNDHV